jgi:integrase
VALYIADLAGRLTAIARLHEMAGHASPATIRHAVVSETLKGIRRTLGTAQKGKLPLLTADLQKLLAHCPENLLGIRDRALLLLGFAGALRRSELAALTVEQAEFNSDGLVILLERSKTDQPGKGVSVAIPFGSHYPTCPVRAMERWLGHPASPRGRCSGGLTGMGRFHRTDCTQIPLAAL